MIGVAMLIAIVVDATVVRTLLVPATMRLLGRADWWAPRPLRRLDARYGIRESDDGDRRDALRRIVVGVLDGLGVEHPLARETRRKLAAALY